MCVLRPPSRALHCKWQSQWRTVESRCSNLVWHARVFPREAELGNMHAAAIVGNMHGNRASRVFAEYLPAIRGLFARASEDFRDWLCVPSVGKHLQFIHTRDINFAMDRADSRTIRSTHQLLLNLMDCQFLMPERALRTIICIYKQR